MKKILSLILTLAFININVSAYELPHAFWKLMCSGADGMKIVALGVHTLHRKPSPVLLLSLDFQILMKHAREKKNHCLPTLQKQK